jgi:endo-1,4-beta-D-glucanase Y
MTVPPTNNRTIAYDNTILQREYAHWKQTYITDTNAGPAPRLRVVGGTQDDTTVSEGQAYGMLLAIAFDDPPTFDRLWLFNTDHLNTTGLMHWHIGGHQQIEGAGAATDADLDMAAALLMAAAKVRGGGWPASLHGLDYGQLAVDMMTAIWRTEIDQPGYETLPGDSWEPRINWPDGITNLSYFSPAYYRLFADVTANADWLKAVNRGYEIAVKAQRRRRNCSGLVPNWNKYDGRPETVAWQGKNSAFWGWDAARYAWRIAMDYDWHQSAAAASQLNMIGGFFSSVGIRHVKAEYTMAGKPVNRWTAPYFIATAAVAIWAAPDPTPSSCGQAAGTLQTTPQQAYDAVARSRRDNYYNDSWRLLSMALMAGKLPRPHLA